MDRAPKDVIVLLRMPGGRRLVREGIYKRRPLKRILSDAPDLSGHRYAQEFQRGGQQVRDVAVLGTDAAPVSAIPLG